jgi:hypothetical protein
MAFTASFTKAGNPPILFGNIVGYRASACFTLGAGFQSEFYLYLVEELLASGKLAEIAIPNLAADFRGELVMTDEDREYTLKDIDLLAIEPGVSRKNRYRVLEFRYDATVSNKGVKASLKFKTGVKLAAGELGEDYRFVAGAGKEELLGFRARQSATGAPVYRFSSLRNKVHSWLERLLRETKDGQTHNPEFTVAFSQGEFKVNPTTASKIFVDESWGVCREWPQPSLASLSVPADQMPPARVAPPALTPLGLLRIDSGTQDARTMDTATFVFQVQNYHNVKLM